MNTLAKKLKQLRNLRKLTQREVAHRSNLSLSTYEKIERGNTQNIYVTTLQQLAKTFDISVNLLLNDQLLYNTSEDKGMIDYLQTHIPTTQEVTMENNTPYSYTNPELTRMVKEHADMFAQAKKRFDEVWQREVIDVEKHKKTLPKCLQ